MSTKTIQEKPILFSTELVQAILDGRKTQTRRVIKEDIPHPAGSWPSKWSNPHWNGDEVTLNDGIGTILTLKSPYGKPGDELWVRETWKPVSYNEHGWIIKYRQDYSTQEIERLFPIEKNEKEIHWAEKTAEEFDEYDKIPWKPSIHMPRWASRIQLKIEDIRVERVQEMSAEDAISEGIPCTAGEAVEAGMFDTSEQPGHEWDNKSSVEHFAELWDSINAERDEGQYAWEENPCVWVVEFKVKNING